MGELVRQGLWRLMADGCAWELPMAQDWSRSVAARAALSGAGRSSPDRVPDQDNYGAHRARATSFRAIGTSVRPHGTGTAIWPSRLGSAPLRYRLRPVAHDASRAARNRPVTGTVPSRFRELRILLVLPPALLAVLMDHLCRKARCSRILPTSRVQQRSLKSSADQLPKAVARNPTSYQKRDGIRFEAPTRRRADAMPHKPDVVDGALRVADCVTLVVRLWDRATSVSDTWRLFTHAHCFASAPRGLAGQPRAPRI